LSGQEHELLDFPRVRELIADRCRTPMGKDLALAIKPRQHSGWVQAEYDRVEELVALEDELPVGIRDDIRPVLHRARQEGLLTGPELVAVRRALAVIRETRQFFLSRRRRAPRVWEIADALEEQQAVERALDKALDDEGVVRDSATPVLESTRKELRRARNRIVERLEKLASDHPDWYSDRPTVRHDRFVLPVRLEARARVAGVIHESSDTGRTLFIEPMETVDRQNELAELRGLEAEETARVLRALSGLVAAQASAIVSSVAAIGGLDLLAAKRRFASDFDCERPEIADNGRFELVAGRHPILAGRKRTVVPLDFRLPDDAHVVLVSGPNAGGKTVVLKTLGLLSLMLGSGVHLPAGAGTRLPLFRQVFADIGDEQSIDADLSSFTAHVVHLKDILERADRQSLVLLDEIGSSTAPEEGAALAVAVLEALRDRGVTVVATSHFGVLKMFVQDEKGMVNAAMGFRDGKPTYRLVFGFPGESNALEIAAGVGLEPRVISRAESRLGREWLDMSTKLRSLDRKLNQAEMAQRAAREHERQGARLKQDYEARLATAEAENLAEREQLRQERERLLVRTRREIENLVREIRESQAGRESVVKAKRFVEGQLAELKGDEGEQEAAGVRAASTDEDPQAGLTVGDKVESRSFRRRGVVTEVRGDEVTVAFGRIRMQLAAGDLTRTDGPCVVVAEKAPGLEPAGFSPRLSIRGMARDEASDAVDRFLDEAVCLGVGAVSILHGKGTGALQRMLWAGLRKDPRVAGFRFGEPFEGGTGLTNVTIKTAGGDVDTGSTPPKPKTRRRKPR